MVKAKSFIRMMQAVRERRQPETGAAMMFAIIVLLISTVVAILVSMLALTSVTATKALGQYVNLNAAVQDAFSNAYVGANGPNGVAFLESHRVNDPSAAACNNTKAARGTVPTGNMSLGAKWSWNSQLVSIKGGGTAYNILAYGYTPTGSCSDTGARKMLLTLTALNAGSGCYTSNGTDCMSVTGGATSAQTIIYQNSDSALFGYGLLGTNSVTFGSSSSNYPKVYSYDSGTTQVPNASGDLGDSTVATNSVLKPYSHSTNVNLFLKLQGASCANQTGGDNDACASIGSQTLAYKADLTLLSQNAYLKNCTSGSAWTASSGVVLSNYGCYSSIDFDADVTVATALKIYTYGNITVRPGVHVNYGGKPSNLQIYSSAQNCNILPSTSTATSTEFFALIAGQNLNCQDNGNAGRLNFYGALATNTLTFSNPNTALFVDDAAKSLSQCSASSACRQLWSASNYQSRN